MERSEKDSRKAAKTQRFRKEELLFCSKLMSSPAIRTVDDDSRLTSGLQDLQAIHENAFLLLSIEKLTHRMPKWIAKEIGARWLYGFADLSGNRYSDRGDSLPFYLPLNQTDRLVAQASGRNQESDVHILETQLAGNIRCGFFYERVQMRSLDVPHKGVEEVG